MRDAQLRSSDRIFWMGVLCLVTWCARTTSRDITFCIYLLLQVNEIKDCELELPVERADKRYFSLNHRGDSKDTWGLVSDVTTVQDGGTLITLRSIIQVYIQCMYNVTSRHVQILTLIVCLASLWYYFMYRSSGASMALLTCLIYCICLKNNKILTQMNIGLKVKCLLFLSDFNQT
jgi:hypothetical protein